MKSIALLFLYSKQNFRRIQSVSDAKNRKWSASNTISSGLAVRNATNLIVDERNTGLLLLLFVSLSDGRWIEDDVHFRLTSRCNGDGFLIATDRKVVIVRWCCLKGDLLIERIFERDFLCRISAESWRKAADWNSRSERSSLTLRAVRSSISVRLYVDWYWLDWVRTRIHQSLRCRRRD